MTFVSEAFSENSAEVSILVWYVWRVREEKLIPGRPGINNHIHIWYVCCFRQNRLVTYKKKSLRRDERRKFSVSFCRREVKTHKPASEWQRSKNQDTFFFEFREVFRYYPDFSPQVLKCLCLSLTLAVINRIYTFFKFHNVPSTEINPTETPLKSIAIYHGLLQ